MSNEAIRLSFELTDAVAAYMETTVRRKLLERKTEQIGTIAEFPMNWELDFLSDVNGASNCLVNALLNARQWLLYI